MHFSLAIQAFMFSWSISFSINNSYKSSFLDFLEFLNLFSNKPFYLELLGLYLRVDHVSTIF